MLGLDCRGPPSSDGVVAAPGRAGATAGAAVAGSAARLVLVQVRFEDDVITLRDDQAVYRIAAQETDQFNRRFKANFTEGPCEGCLRQGGIGAVLIEVAEK